MRGLGLGLGLSLGVAAAAAADAIATILASGYDLLDSAQFPRTYSRASAARDPWTGAEATSGTFRERLLSLTDSEATIRQGFLEISRTNVVLHNRDLTDAAWVKTNCTAAKDQTGVDGTANGASSITATDANATVLQAITLASSARFQSAYVKRITGTGTVNMTLDGGATWTAVTVTAEWTRVEIPTQTLADPEVGFRLVTSGDAIAVDFVQNENGVWSSTPIPTTTASVTRAADNMVIDVSGLPGGGISAAAGELFLIHAMFQCDMAGPSGNHQLISDSASRERLVYRQDNNTQVRFQRGNATTTNGSIHNVAVWFERDVQDCYSLTWDASTLEQRKNKNAVEAQIAKSNGYDLVTDIGLRSIFGPHDNPCGSLAAIYFPTKLSISDREALVDAITTDPEFVL